MEKPYVPVCHFGCSCLQSIYNAEIYFAESSSTKPDVPKSEIGGSSIFTSSNNLRETVTVELEEFEIFSFLLWFELGIKSFLVRCCCGGK
jgi:hypothetical protein